MSEENHPNVNAVKLMLDVHKTILDSLRGPAAQRQDKISFMLLNETRKFAIKISELLDEEVGIEVINKQS